MMNNDIKEVLRLIIKEELSPINENIKNIEKKIDGITEQVAENAENITKIKSNQETISNVINQMASLQKQQDETINILARRSIDQEAELRKIK